MAVSNQIQEYIPMNTTVENNTTTKKPAPKTVAKPAAAKRKTPAAKKTAAKAKVVKSANGKNLIPVDAVIKWVGPNEFKEGSDVHARVETVRKAHGKTREAIEKLSGVRTSTVPNLVRMGLCAVA